LYSLAGGAAEVDCGLSPAIENTEFGSYPASMGHDFQNLRNEIDGDMWDALRPFLRDCFNVLINYFRGIADRIWAVARNFLDKKVLTFDQLGLDFIDRSVIVRSTAGVLNLPEPPELAVE